MDHLLRYQPGYGKTLIFVRNVLQAVLLVDRLRAAGVAAEYVAGDRHDGRDNREVLRRFRDPGRRLDVLVNVDLLTEGADFPAVQTVFLRGPRSARSASIR